MKTKYKDSKEIEEFHFQILELKIYEEEKISCISYDILRESGDENTVGFSNHPM